MAWLRNIIFRHCLVILLINLEVYFHYIFFWIKLHVHICQIYYTLVQSVNETLIIMTRLTYTAYPVFFFLNEYCYRCRVWGCYCTRYQYGMYKTSMWTCKRPGNIKLQTQMLRSAVRKQWIMHSISLPVSLAIIK